MNTTELTLFDKILDDVEDILDLDVTLDEKLFAICELLGDEVSTFDWVGFYKVNPENDQELVLGPFIGEATEHKRIPFGEGICGQVAESHETYVSQDVRSEENYIACSTKVQSEIVVPIMKGNTFVAQLDIDSHKKNSITEEQRELLEEICDLLGDQF